MFTVYGFFFKACGPAADLSDGKVIEIIDGKKKPATWSDQFILEGVFVLAKGTGAASLALAAGGGSSPVRSSGTWKHPPASSDTVDIFDDQAQSASTEDASVEVLCYFFLVNAICIHEIYLSIYIYMYVCMYVGM